MRTLLVCAAIAILTSATGLRIATAAEMDPVVGTWKLDMGKSLFKAGPSIRSQTRTYSQSGEEITLEMKTVGVDGKEGTTHTTYQLNGKDYAVTGTPDYDSLSAKKINTRTAHFTLKKGGKIVGRSTRTVSKDGKKLTSTQRLTTAMGGKTDYVLVFDKE